MKRKLLLCLSLLLLTGCAGEASMTLTPKKLKTQTENVLHILNWKTVGVPFCRSVTTLPPMQSQIHFGIQRTFS